MYLFLSGILMFGCIVGAMCFWRAYRRTADRLFGYFALSFLLLSLERVLLAISNQPEVSSPFAYIPRLVAFGLILLAIVEKNRSRSG